MARHDAGRHAALDRISRGLVQADALLRSGLMVPGSYNEVVEPQTGLIAGLIGVGTPMLRARYGPGQASPAWFAGDAARRIGYLARSEYPRVAHADLDALAEGYPLPQFTAQDWQCLLLPARLRLEAAQTQERIGLGVELDDRVLALLESRLARMDSVEPRASRAPLEAHLALVSQRVQSRQQRLAELAAQQARAHTEMLRLIGKTHGAMCAQVLRALPARIGDEVRAQHLRASWRVAGLFLRDALGGPEPADHFDPVGPMFHAFARSAVLRPSVLARALNLRVTGLDEAMRSYRSQNTRPAG